ncbi:MAG TPA: Mov34/MPN/PAD-1 family protein [Planctomicrobium sp.]|nr:Mov34/MPN/PAD-1 family protein [Planctomicrobium sp.]
MGLNRDQQEQPRPDLASAATRLWPEKPFPVSGMGERPFVPVVIRQSVLNAIMKHGQSRLDAEICGVLVGNGYRDALGAFLFVEASIPGEHSDNQLTQVTFTSETWSHIHQELDRRYADLRILGWYHTHPGFGIFLSEMDLFIHENFFNSGDQLALVYDPHQEERGLFTWQQGNVKPQDFVIDQDVPPHRSNRRAGFSHAVITEEGAEPRSRPSQHSLRKRHLLWSILFLVIGGLALVLWRWFPLEKVRRGVAPAPRVNEMFSKLQSLREEPQS